MPRNISLEVPTPENLEFLRQRAQAERDMLDAAQNKNIASRVTPYVEAALATVAPMFTAPAAAAYGMGRTLATPFMGPVQREKTGDDFVYATPQDQAAADFMRLATFMPRTQKGQEYTQNVAELFEASKLPHAWPVSGNPPKLGPRALQYADMSIRNAYDQDLIPQPGFSTIDVSKRKLFTLPKVEEKPAQVPAVIPEQQGALPVADPGRREFLKRGASNVVTGAMLDATPIGVLTKLAAEPVAKAVAEAPIVSDLSGPIASYIAKVITDRDLANYIADQTTYTKLDRDRPPTVAFESALGFRGFANELPHLQYDKLISKLGLTIEQLASAIGTTPENVKNFLQKSPTKNAISQNDILDYAGGIAQIDYFIDEAFNKDGRPVEAYRMSPLQDIIEDSNAVRTAIKNAIKEYGRDADIMEIAPSVYDELYNEFKKRQFEKVGVSIDDPVATKLFDEVVRDENLRELFDFALEPVEDEINQRVTNALQGRKFRKITLDEDYED